MTRETISTDCIVIERDSLSGYNVSFAGEQTDHRITLWGVRQRIALLKRQKSPTELKILNHTGESNLLTQPLDRSELAQLLGG